ncbi:hypothetical protein GWK47_014289 [Chionoecetes opilio]|uniref:Uncharacterized protein n=1 Tax=Chionoecetes opilio TaxID=41210 RepID=A0A8J4Y099_CHIOP|nr:hypothetical protein GWK47_014289 [Chionoecetes opilio]
MALQGSGYGHWQDLVDTFGRDRMGQENVDSCEKEAYAATPARRAEAAIDWMVRESLGAESWINVHTETNNENAWRTLPAPPKAQMKGWAARWPPRPKASSQKCWS